VTLITGATMDRT